MLAPQIEATEITPASIADFTVYDQHLKSEANWKEIENSASAGDVAMLDVMFMSSLLGLAEKSDLKTARMWHARAIQKSAPLALFYHALNLKGFFLDASRIDDAASTSQLKVLRDYFRAIAEQKRSSFAMAAYARCLDELGDTEAAIPWMKNAAEQGNPWAMTTLASWIQNEHGFQSGQNDGVELLKKAVALHFPAAMKELGTAHLEALNTPKNPERGMAFLAQAAELGFAPAQFEMGYRCRYGNGIPTDYIEARKWLNSASAQDFGPAVSLLAIMNAEGIDDKADPKKAMELAEHAIAIGDPNGFYAMGFLYGKGIGVPLDSKRAGEYFERGIERNDLDSVNALAVAYELGDGVKQDLQKSLDLLLIAANRAPNRYSETLAFFLSRNDGDKFKFKQSAAIELLKNLAGKNNAPACYYVAFLYFNGDGVQKDWAESFRLMRIAAEAGYHKAKHELAEYYTTGIGTVENHEESYRWHESASRDGCELAALKVGKLKIQGWGTPRDEDGGLRIVEGVAEKENSSRKDAFELLQGCYGSGYYNTKKDPVKLLKWMKIGAEAKVPGCSLGYAKCLLKGTEKDKELAIGFLINAAEKENQAEAAYELGLAHKDGIGTEEDPSYAFKYMKKAVEGNYMWAKWELSEMYRLGIGTRKNPAEADRWRAQAQQNGADGKRPKEEDLEAIKDAVKPPAPPGKGDF